MLALCGCKRWQIVFKNKSYFQLLNFKKQYERFWQEAILHNV
jgi:hypothetical protein